MQWQIAGLDNRRYFCGQIGADTGNLVELFLSQIRNTCGLIAN
jgi:hypothetical protein